MSLTTAEFARRVVIVGAIAAVAVIVWRLINVVLLIFGGIILAVALVSLARLLMRYLHLGRRWALAVVICLIAVAVLWFGTLMGARLDAQFGQLGFGLLFGPIGIILAHPLMVCAMVLVEELYVGGSRRPAEPGAEVL